MQELLVANAHVSDWQGSDGQDEVERAQREGHRPKALTECHAALPGALHLDGHKGNILARGEAGGIHQAARVRAASGPMRAAHSSRLVQHKAHASSTHSSG